MGPGTAAACGVTVPVRKLAVPLPHHIRTEQLFLRVGIPAVGVLLVALFALLLNDSPIKARGEQIAACYSKSDDAAEDAGEVPTYFRVYALARIRFRGGRSAVRRHRIFSIDCVGHLKPIKHENLISDGKQTGKAKPRSFPFLI